MALHGRFVLSPRCFEDRNRTDGASRAPDSTPALGGEDGCNVVGKPGIALCLRVTAGLSLRFGPLPWPIIALMQLCKSVLLVSTCANVQKALCKLANCDANGRRWCRASSKACCRQAAGSWRVGTGFEASPFQRHWPGCPQGAGHLPGPASLVDAL